MKASPRTSRSSKLALECLILTPARSVGVRKATWDEINVDGAMWMVREKWMKANREQVLARVFALDCIAIGTYIGVH